MSPDWRLPIAVYINILIMICKCLPLRELSVAHHLNLGALTDEAAHSASVTYTRVPVYAGSVLKGRLPILEVLG
jgi:hypothetical protein